MENNSLEKPPPVISVEHNDGKVPNPKHMNLKSPVENTVVNSRISQPSQIVSKPAGIMDPAPCFMKLRIGFSVTGVFVGLSILVCFQADPGLRNLHIALWGLASAVFALMTTFVHIAHLKWNRDEWVHRLKATILIGFIVQAGCVIAFLTYIIIAAVEKQPLMPLNSNDQGYYVAAVWVFMTWKWSFGLFWYSRAYRRMYTTRYEMIP